MTADSSGPVPSVYKGTGDLAPQVHLRILATSDLHMHLAGHDYHADTTCVRKGLCLTATLIAQARAEVDGSVLLDNGDFLQGSPLGDHVARNDVRPNPMVQAMIHLGYDAVNLGNHEFSLGIDTLVAAAAEAPFPILSANTIPSAESPLGGILRPWAIIERTLTDTSGRSHTVRLGVIGVLPPQTEIWDRQAIDGQVQMRPLAGSVARQVPEVRAAGADVIVVLAHCGISSAPDDVGPPDGGLDVAGIDGVDAVVMGHVHAVFPGPGHIAVAGVDCAAATLLGKPAVMPGFFGSHLGVIDLDLIQSENGWRVAGHRVAVRAISVRDAEGNPVPLVAPDETLAALVRPAHEATRAWVRRPVGHAPSAIHSFFAMVTDCPSVQIVNDAQAEHVRNRLVEGALGHLPVLSATAPFRVGGIGGPENYTYIPPGDILLRHAVDLYVHPNTIMALQITAQELRNWLEYSVRGYRKIVPGLADQPLFRPEIPSFAYDTIAGLTYEIDLSAPPVDQGGQRIKNLRWKNAPIDPTQAFIVATNSYRGSGNGGCLPPQGVKVVLDEKTAITDILITHIGRVLKKPRLDLAGAPPNWRFRPMPQTSVVFDTSPWAERHLTDQPHLPLTPLCRTMDGFLRMRLTL